MKLLITLFSLVTLISFGQDTKADGILNKLSSKMKAQKSFYIEFSAYIKNSTNGTDISEKGKGWVKDEKYYASYGENTIISNGVKSWTIVKEEKTVYVTDASEDDDESMNPKKLMTIWENDFKSKYEKESTLNGEAVHIINLYPKNPKTVDYHTIILYVSKNDSELKKAIMKTKDGTVMTYTVTKFTSNPSIEDSKFVFDKNKYPGYSVIRD